MEHRQMELGREESSAKPPAIKPGRTNGRNSEYRSGATKIKHSLRMEIEAVLKANQDKAATKKKKVGARTQEIRSTTIFNFFSDLYFLHYEIQSLSALKQKHIVAVFNFLEEQGQSPSTIQNKISVMRVFCEWIGKNGMVRDSREYVRQENSVRRTMVVQEDKSWAGKGIEVLEKLEQIRQMDGTVAIWLELCWAFGLRIREAVDMRPAVAHEGEHVWIREGTKGDRPRVIPIENQTQLDVLERAKQAADQKTHYLGMRNSTEKQRIRRVYYVLEKCGVTLKEDGITAHGVRHQYMHQRFTKMLGIEPPIRGGDISTLDKNEFSIASSKLMESAGHSRESIGAAYYGSRRIPPEQKAAILKKRDTSAKA